MNLTLATFAALLVVVDMNRVSAGRSKEKLPIHGNNGDNKIDISSNGFSATSKAASGLLASSTRVLEDNENYYNFVAGYSVKFQGCHHISQWNGDAEGDDAVRIRSKRMVRYRLCPTGYCDDDYDGGCKSKYGDYVVDLNTFVYYYLTADAEEQEERCNEYEDVCEEECEGDDAYDYCQQTCLKNHGVRNGCDGDDNDDNADFDVADYAQCAAYEGFQGDDDSGNQNYVGPYCAEQGGSVYLGLFTDETCTTFSGCGDTCFYNKMGFMLPYGSESLVDDRCMSCSENYLEKEQGAYYAEDEDGLREFCQTIYAQSGKCEARMNSQYPNESACTYIEGIKIIRNDGVLRTSGTRKSRPAAVAIGLMATSGVLLTAYVYYLRTKLSRAKVNLTSSASAVYA